MDNDNGGRSSHHTQSAGGKNMKGSIKRNMKNSIKKSIKVLVPHRISGFFQMQDPDKSNEVISPLNIGSRGGGPALTAYGETLIEAESVSSKPVPQKTETGENSHSHSSDLQYRIFINRQDRTHTAWTSLSVLQLMNHLLPPNQRITIHHEFELPSGAGYGSSGAGALGIALGLNDLFNLGLSPLEAAQYAHIAEVQNHTGLGTVAGQFAGGLSIVLKPGYPFITKKIPVPSNFSLVLASWGAISTKEVLTDPIYKRLIFEKGKVAMAEMEQDWSVENYMRVCRNFLTNTQMLQKFQLPVLSEVITELNQATELGASLNQLGKSVFCFCSDEERDEVVSIIKRYQPTFGPKFVKVADEGFEITTQK